MNKFQLFLGKLKTPENALLIESISTGYKICMESFQAEDLDTLVDEYLFRFNGNSDENPWKYVIDNPQSEGVKFLRKWIASIVSDADLEYVKKNISEFREYISDKIVNPVSNFSEEDERLLLGNGNEAMTMATDADDHLVLQYAIDRIDSPEFISALKNPQLTVDEFIHVANEVVRKNIESAFQQAKQ